MTEPEVIGRATVQITCREQRYTVKFLGVKHHGERIGWPFDVYRPDGSWWFINTTGEMTLAEAIEYAEDRIWWKQEEESRR